MRRAIVHAGLPRCASTSLQHALVRLRPALAAAGVLYPDLTPASTLHHRHINHQHLGETLDGRRPRREREELLRALAGALDGRHDTVFISYESLIEQPRRRRTPEILAELFARHGYAMETLVLVKPQSEYLNSFYTHRVQFLRETRAFARFARAHGGDARFDYEARVAPWRAACAGRVRAVAVRERGNDAPLLLRVCAAVGLQDRLAPLLTAQDLERVENRSPGPYAIEAARRLRAVLLHRRLRVGQRELTDFVEKAAVAAGLDRERFRGVDAPLRARVEARYAASNERFARQAWNRAWEEVVEAEAPGETNELAARRLAAPAEAAVQELVRQACRHCGVAPAHLPGARPLNALVDAVEYLRMRLRAL